LIVVLVSALAAFSTRIPTYKQKLSEYNLFNGPLADLQPVEGVVPYDLNTPLFTDYAFKSRFVKLPTGLPAIYHDSSVFSFPVGTVLIKNFYYPADFRHPDKNIKLIETRLLIHEQNGWVALPYIWNEAQTDASLEVAGGVLDVSWKHYNGKKRSVKYLVPTMNQCKGCHEANGEFTPIGPAARHLNKQYNYVSGWQNQLVSWTAKGMLSGLPEDHRTIQRNAVFNDPSTGDVNARARAWLDINCGHCHSSQGPANTSGLFLDVFEQGKAPLGIYKSPIAAGRAAGNQLYDIVPGKPNESILLHRLLSNDPGIKMPEIGRNSVHEEGVALIREWIKQMEH
jgi:uncharacterized repeat protein (TIGR03806 family)